MRWKYWKLLGNLGNAADLLDGHVRRGGSTWQSLHRGSGSVEADFINGEIVALGQRLGLPTPVTPCWSGSSMPWREQASSTAGGGQPTSWPRLA